MTMQKIDCTHKELKFGSADYYISCGSCGALWIRGKANQREYGVGTDGEPIGAAPEEAGHGAAAHLSGHIRADVAESRTENEELKSLLKRALEVGIREQGSSGMAAEDEASKLYGDIRAALRKKV
jgi:hypothetical protein